MGSITNRLYALETWMIDVEDNNGKQILNANVKYIKIMKSCAIKSELVSLKNFQKQTEKQQSS